jgi:hypothetical protein
VTGAGLLGYRYYSRPVTLTVAVGSFDGEAASAMTAIAGRLVSFDAPVRLSLGAYLRRLYLPPANHKKGCSENCPYKRADV